MKKAFFVVAALILTLSFVYARSTRTLGEIPTFRFAAPTAPVISKSDPESPVYGHPLVPGGIHTQAELGKARGLYPGLTYAYFTTLGKSMFAYVSYERNGKIYWSKKTRLILAGEPIITDGSMIILQRCGNVIRTDAPPVEETLLDEPTDIYPTAPPDEEIAVPVIYAPPVESLYTPPSTSIAPPSNTPGVALLVPNVISSIPVTPSTHIILTPEPSVFLMLVLGGFCLWLIWAITPREKR